MTKVSEISVPPQKNFGGLKPVCINATIQGNDPRAKLCPRTINPTSLFEIPQVSALLRDRPNDTTDDCVTIAHPTNTIKIFLIIV